MRQQAEDVPAQDMAGDNQDRKGIRSNIEFVRRDKDRDKGETRIRTRYPRSSRVDKQSSKSRDK